MISDKSTIKLCVFTVSQLFFSSVVPMIIRFIILQVTGLENNIAQPKTDKSFEPFVCWDLIKFRFDVSHSCSFSAYIVEQI